MTQALLITVLLSLASGVLAITLTKSVMTLFTSGAIISMPDEEYRGSHGITAGQFVTMGVLAATATYVLSVSFGGGISSILFAVFAAFGVSISYTDFLDYIIFNIVVYPLYLFTALGLVIYWHVNNLGGDFLLGALNGGLFSFFLYLLLWVFSGYRLGFGDVRLSAPIGAVAGAFGSGLPLAAIFGANFLALLVIILVSITGLRKEAHVAFGPFMIAGLFLALLARTPIMDWWITNTKAIVWLFQGMPM